MKDWNDPMVVEVRNAALAEFRVIQAGAIADRLADKFAGVSELDRGKRFTETVNAAALELGRKIVEAQRSE